MSFSIQVTTIDSWSVEKRWLEDGNQPTSMPFRSLVSSPSLVIPLYDLSSGALWPNIAKPVWCCSTLLGLLTCWPLSLDWFSLLCWLHLPVPYIVILSLVQSCLAVCLPTVTPCLAHNSIVNALFWHVSRFSVATDLYMSPPTDYTIVHILWTYIYPHHLPGTWHMIGT